MSGFKNTFNDRRSAAEGARKALLEKFKSRPGPDDPEVQARAAERAAIAAAREERETARRIEKAEAERVAREAEEVRKREAAAAKAAADTSRKAEMLAAQKAARDARYAARKARKR